MTQDLQLKQSGDTILNDFESTNWKSISNETHHQITEELHMSGFSSVAKGEVTESKIDPDKPFNELDGFSLVATVSLHSGNAPAGHTLEEYQHIFKKGNEFAIKRELFDVDSYGLPEATYLEKGLTATQVVTQQNSLFENREESLYINGIGIKSIKELQDKLNLTTTTMEKQEEVSITGYVGKNPQYKKYESGKSTIGFTMKATGKEGDWIHVRAYNEQAEKLQTAFEKENIEKLTVSGNSWKPVAYESKKNPGTKVEYNEFQINDVIKHKVMEIAGNIGKVENKTTSKGKAFTEILVISDQPGEGKSDKILYNVTLWEDKQKGVPNEVKIKVGEPLAVKGEANILENKEGSKQYVSIQAWNLDITPEKLQAQIQAKQKTATTSKEETKEKSAKPEKGTKAEKGPKKSSSKGKEQSM